MYVKLFTSLYQGTLRGRTNEIMVFTNMLAHADKDGVVDMHWRAIAEETGLSEDAVKTSAENLQAPDSESRSPELGGCRIVKLDEHRAWGWQIVNYAKYRAIRNEDDRKEQNRASQERWRNKHPSAAVSHGKPPSAHAEAEADTKAEAKEQKHGRQADRFHEFWKAYPKKVSKGAAEKAWKQAKVTGPMMEPILAAIITAKETAAWRESGGKFIPHPATWLNRKGWEDSHEVEINPLDKPKTGREALMEEY